MGVLWSLYLVFSSIQAGAIFQLYTMDLLLAGPFIEREKWLKTGTQKWDTVMQV